jgi:hypothetical protein
MNIKEYEVSSLAPPQLPSMSILALEDDLILSCAHMVSSMFALHLGFIFFRETQRKKREKSLGDVD